VIDRLQLLHDFRHAREHVLAYSRRRERMLYGVMFVAAVVVTMMFWSS